MTDEAIIHTSIDDTLVENDKTEIKTIHGYSYHQNVLKMLVLDAAIHYPHMKFTLREICEFRDLPLSKVQKMVSIWCTRKYRYFTRLKKRTSNHENVYKIRKAAITYYLKYKKRFDRGFDLNLKRRYPIKVQIYAHINGYGRERGLTDEHLPTIVLPPSTLGIK